MRLCGATFDVWGSAMLTSESRRRNGLFFLLDPHLFDDGADGARGTGCAAEDGVFAVDGEAAELARQAEQFGLALVERLAVRNPVFGAIDLGVGDIVVEVAQVAHLHLEAAVAGGEDDLIVEVDAVVDQRRALEVKILLDAANYQTLSAVGVLNAGLRQMVKPLGQLFLVLLLEQTV